MRFPFVVGCQDRGAERGRTVPRGYVPGFLRGAEFAGPSGWQPAVSWSHGFGQDSYRGSGGGNTVWGRPHGNQGGLRGVPALTRNRETDWLTSGLPRPPGNPSTDYAGSAGGLPHG